MQARGTYRAAEDPAAGGRDRARPAGGGPDHPVGAQVDVWSAALINIILFLSLGLLVRRSGQISLCHLAFAAVGAAAFGHFAAATACPGCSR